MLLVANVHMVDGHAKRRIPGTTADRDRFKAQAVENIIADLVATQQSLLQECGGIGTIAWVAMGDWNMTSTSMTRATMNQAAGPEVHVIGSDRRDFILSSQPLVRNSELQLVAYDKMHKVVSAYVHSDRSLAATQGASPRTDPREAYVRSRELLAQMHTIQAEAARKELAEQQQREAAEEQQRRHEEEEEQQRRTRAEERKRRRHELEADVEVEPQQQWERLSHNRWQKQPGVQLVARALVQEKEQQRAAQEEEEEQQRAAQEEARRQLCVREEERRRAEEEEERRREEEEEERFRREEEQRREALQQRQVQEEQQRAAQEEARRQRREERRRAEEEEERRREEEEERFRREEEQRREALRQRRVQEERQRAAQEEEERQRAAQEEEEERQRRAAQEDARRRRRVREEEQRRAEEEEERFWREEEEDRQRREEEKRCRREEEKERRRAAQEEEERQRAAQEEEERQRAAEEEAQRRRRVREEERRRAVEEEERFWREEEERRREEEEKRFRREEEEEAEEQPDFGGSSSEGGTKSTLRHTPTTTWGESRGGPPSRALVRMGDGQWKVSEELALHNLARALEVRNQQLDLLNLPANAFLPKEAQVVAQKALRSEWLVTPVGRQVMSEVQLMPGGRERHNRTLESYYRRSQFEDYGGREWCHCLLALGTVDEVLVQLYNQLRAERREEALSRPQGPATVPRSERPGPATGVNHRVSAAKEARNRAKRADKEAHGAAHAPAQRRAELERRADELWQEAERLSLASGAAFTDRYGVRRQEQPRDFLTVLLQRYCARRGWQYC